MKRSQAKQGTVVKTTEPIPLTWTDRLIGGGVQSGKEGVIVGAEGRKARVTFTGKDGRTLWVRTRRLRLAKEKQALGDLRGPVRAAVIVFLAVPLVRFVAAYVWEHGFSGLPSALGNGLVDGLSAWSGVLADHPARALVHIAFLAAVTRLAFR
ncbi:MAG: hypothetical protein J2O46_10390 [Nocardioides sp.]|nr:hypothetical protein [Nocardioides sp.]